MSSIDGDEEDQQVVVQYQAIWRFSRWDVVAAVFHIGGGVFHALSEGFRHVAISSSAHANWTRQNYDNEQIEAWNEQRRRDAERETAEILGLPETTDGIPEAEK